jgi:phosphoserine phosphatase RsbU/P
MQDKNTKLDEIHLEKKVSELELKLNSQKQLNDEKTAIMKKTIAETEDLARHLQNTTLALIQERQIANAKAEKEKLVNKWVEKINASFDLDSLLSIFVQEIGEFLNLDRCGIVIFHNDSILDAKEYAKAKYARKGQQDKLNDLESLSVESIKGSFLVDEINKQRKKIIENAILPNDEDELLKDTKSLMAFPVIVRKKILEKSISHEQKASHSLGDEILGIVYLQQCESKRDWHDKEIDLLTSIVSPLSVSIEKSLLYLDARKRTKYAELLNNLTTQIRSSLNLSEILARTVNELGLALKASRCFLYFDGYISDEYCELEVPSIADKIQHLILDKFRDEQSFSAIAIDNIQDPLNLKRLNDEELKDLELSQAVSALACPLHFQGILQGWIVFHSFDERKWTEDEIAFVEAAGSQVIVAMTQSRMYEKLNSYQEKLSRELKQAARVQTSLIGGDVFDVSLETSVFYKAHSNVSGDFYWVAELAPDIVSVLIGDVSGKGPAAALLTGYLLGEFNSAIANSALAWFPDKMISFLCQSILYQNASSDFYATAWYGVFDLNKGKMKYTNAGHLNPYMIQNGEVTQLDANEDCGVPLGLINPKDLEEVYIAREVDFNEGDKMVLFTDGVLDQKMPDGHFVPKDWMYNTIKKIQHKDVKEITFELNETLNTLSGSTPLSDDRLMISLEGVSFSIKEFSVDDPSKMNDLIDQIIKECVDYNMPRDKQITLRLGITEAISNAVRHGSKNREDQMIKIGYKIDKGSFKMTIVDPGPGFNWQVYNYTAIDDVLIDEEGGRGIPLLLEIFDKVTWNYLGNHLGLFFYW